MQITLFFFQDLVLAENSPGRNRTQYTLVFEPIIPLKHYLQPYYLSFMFCNGEFQ